jgi:acetyltransferase
MDGRYPFELVDIWRARSGARILIRPVHPQDAELVREFVRELSPQSRYNRFHQPLADLTPEMARWATDVDHERHVALIAEVFDGAREVEIGAARYVRPEGSDAAEVAVAVADAWQRQGIGERLLRGLVQAAARRGVHWLEGEVLKDNAAMLALARRLGFQARAPRRGAVTLQIDRRITPEDAGRAPANARGDGWGWLARLGWAADSPQARRA